MDLPSFPHEELRYRYRLHLAKTLAHGEVVDNDTSYNGQNKSRELLRRLL